MSPPAASMFFFFAIFGLAAATNPEDQAYLDKNAEKDGVVVLPSGLQYEVLHSGPAEGASTDELGRTAVPFRTAVSTGNPFGWQQ